LVRFREDFNKLGEEMTKLREDMILGFKRHDEVLEKHVQEIAKLREDFNKMLSVIVQIQEEPRKLRESYERLEKYVESLEESQIRLKKHMVSLEKDLKSLEGAMLRGFADMSKFAGTTFEEFVRVF
jgi:chromosome segregation ATPase